MNSNFNKKVMSSLCALFAAGCVGDQAGSSSSELASSLSAVSSSAISSSTQSSDATVESSSENSSEASSSAMGVPADAALVYALNAGAGVTAQLNGTIYNADRFATGGMTQIITDAIDGVEDDALYQSERYGSYAYEIPVSAATYSVRLHFTELYHTAAELRLFSVSLEGQPVISEFDVFDEVGGKSAYEITINNIAVADGSLSIKLDSVVDNATISGIAVYSTDGGQFEEPPEPVCNDAERQTPRMVNYDAEYPGGNRFFNENTGGPRGFVIEHASESLQHHTIYRPQTLLEGDKLPIVAWGNGGCSNVGLDQAEFLSEIASHGYIAIAHGAPNGNGSARGSAAELIKAIDWAIAENSRECSQLYGKLDVESIATVGWSCGGELSHRAAVDPRVSTGVALNSGFINNESSVIAQFHAPMAIFNGNQSAIEYSNGLREYNDVNNVPIYHANHASLDHGDAYFQNNGGDMGRAVVGWLNWQLKDDTSATGEGLFFGNNCFMCGSPWTSMDKGF